MDKRMIVGLGVMLAGCGGGIDGNYVGAPGNVMTIDIQSDKATVSMGTQSKAGTVSKADKSVFITIEKQTKEFKVDDKGCLVNDEMGPFCKK